MSNGFSLAKAGQVNTLPNAQRSQGIIQDSGLAQVLCELGD